MRETFLATFAHFHTSVSLDVDVKNQAMTDALQEFVGECAEAVKYRATGNYTPRMKPAWNPIAGGSAITQ